MAAVCGFFVPGISPLRAGLGFANALKVKSWQEKDVA